MVAGRRLGRGRVSGRTAKLVIRALAGVFATVMFGLAALPGSALAAGTLSTSAATNVQIRSAVLNGSSSGWSAGDYCAFEYFDGAAGGPTATPPTGPAVPCGTTSTPQAYSYTLTGLTPGDTYYYAAVHCAATMVSNGQTFCNPTTIYPYGWDQIDPCWSNAAFCPHFTAGMPTGTTLAATNVRGTSATFNATLNFQDEESNLVNYFFEYSTDPNFLGYSSTPLGGPPLGSSGTATVSQTVTGLTPGTQYYYRVVVGSGETNHGPTPGNGVSFTTGGFVRTDAATSVHVGGAVLNGEVYAGDTAVSYSWLYSTSSATSNGVLSNGAVAVAGGTVSAGTDQNVTATISGLSGGTTYYFQLVTSDPSIVGTVVSLTTLPSNCSANALSLSDSQIASTGFLVTGCWSGLAGVYTGNGTVEINGVTFSGPSTGTVTIDTNKQQITTSHGYDVNVGSVRMYSGALSGPISKDYSNSSSGGTLTSAFDLGATDSSSQLYDLPLGGFARLTASSQGGSTVEISALGLPSLFGGVTADGSVTVAEDGTVDGVHAQLGDSMIGPITLPGFTLDGDPSTNTWTGDVNLMFPLAKVGITATVTITNGKLNGLGASFSGTDIALDDSGLFLAGGGFSTIFSPFTLQGSLDVAFGPKVSGYDLLDINAGFYAGFNQDQTLTGLPGITDGTVLHNVPFTFGIDGTLNLLGFIQLASTDYRYYGVPGWPFVTMKSSLGQALIASCGKYGIGFSPSLTLAGDARGSQFNLVASGSASLDLCAFQVSVGVQGVISSTGMALCGSFLGNSVGAGLTWPTSFGSLSDLTNNFSLYTSGCNVSNYYTAISVARAGHASGLRAPLRLPPGLPFAVIRVRGNGAPPLVHVAEPHGASITMQSLQGVTAARAKYLVIPDAANDTTYVELTRPRAGSYSVTALPGSAPIVQVAAAHGEAAPRVHGTLRRRGSRRILSWHALRTPGQRLVFREIGAGGDRTLLSTRRASGHFSFRPLPGLNGSRSIVADVYRGGVLAKTIPLARYFGPVITKPGSVRNLRVTRKHRRLTIMWKRATGTIAHYLVLVATSDGRHRLFITRHPHLTLQSVPATGKVLVTVTAANALGTRGPMVRSGLTKHKHKHKPKPKHHRSAR